MEVKRSHILSLQIDNESDVGVCRRKSVSLASEMGFSDVKTGEVAIIVTEMVTNVLKHGGGKGKIIICQIENEIPHKAIEIWCCDGGKGIPNFTEALHDGYSASNTLGLGLGSIRRFSDELEINPKSESNFSDFYFNEIPNFTNCIRSRKWLPNKQWMGTNKYLEVGAASRCKPGEELNGDAYVVSNVNSNHTVAAVIDGLGHGKEAHLASQLAKEQIIQSSEQNLEVLLNQIHQKLKGTRGAVVGLLLIDTNTKKLYFSGIGNIDGFVSNKGEKKSFLSFGGIVGHNMRTPRIFEFDFYENDFLCLFSDGITTRWNYSDIDWNKHPQQNAEYLINHFSRQNDDATVLIIQHHS